jgi:DNA polymerase III subunit epsilon
MSDLRYIIFDTETTGIDANKQAVEVAMLEVDQDLNVLGEASSLIRPTCPIGAEAAAVHGITEEMLADAPTIEQWVDMTFGGPLEGRIALIGHRIGFDRPLFAPIGQVAHELDTLELCWVHVHGLPNRKLDTLKEHLQLPGGGESHRAMADVITCHQLLQWLIPRTGRTLQALATTPYTILQYCPWGKHEGKLLMDVPRGYREWMLGLDNLSLSLRRSLEMVALADVTITIPKKSARPPARRNFNIPKRNFR